MFPIDVFRSACVTGARLFRFVAIAASIPYCSGRADRETVAGYQMPTCIGIDVGAGFGFPSKSVVGATRRERSKPPARRNPTACCPGLRSPHCRGTTTGWEFAGAAVRLANVATQGNAMARRRATEILVMRRRLKETSDLANAQGTNHGQEGRVSGCAAASHAGLRSVVPEAIASVP